MEWKKIENDNYSISKNGEVRNNTTNKKLKPRLKNGYYSIDINRKTMYIHRLLAMAFIPNPEDKPFVDHKDGNQANNKLENLRWCTRKDNNRNKKNHGKYKKGVNFCKDTNKYRAKIYIDGKTKCLGRFQTEDEAHEAYCKKAKEVFGDFFRKQ